MGIKKQYFKTKKSCKVTFTLSKDESNGAREVHVVGEFNNWSTTATPMKRSRNGIFKATVDLPPGRHYQFRYLLDGRLWRNETEADGAAETPYQDACNSVIAI